MSSVAVIDYFQPARLSVARINLLTRGAVSIAIAKRVKVDDKCDTPVHFSCRINNNSSINDWTVKTNFKLTAVARAHGICDGRRKGCDSVNSE